METAMDMVVEARKNRPYVSNILVLLRLMTHLWVKEFIKDSNPMLTIPIGWPVLTNTCHEPLYISLIILIIRISNLKGLWFIWWIELSSTCMEHLEGGMDPLSLEGDYSKCGNSLLNGGGGGFIRIFLRVTGITTLYGTMEQDLLSPPSFE